MVFWTPRRNHRGITDPSAFPASGAGPSSSGPHGSGPRADAGTGSGPPPGQRTGSAPGLGPHFTGHRWRPRARLARSRDDRLVAGVAGGLARFSGLDVTLIRVVLVLMALLSGFGLFAYVVAWLVLPVDGQPGTIGARAMADRKGLIIVVAFVPALVAFLVVTSAFNAGFLSSFVWFAYFALAGLALIYRNAGSDERAWLRQGLQPALEIGSRSRRSLVARVLIGVALLAGGASLFTLGHPKRIALGSLAGLGLMVAAVVVIFGPWWLRLTRDLMSERQARIRAEERADLAARVHDSVLQTLALIQRSAAEPDTVVQLARTQERDLRSWLFDARRPRSDGTAGATVAAAVEQIAYDVETAHGVPVDVVAVGDCPLDDDLSAMLAAGREAMVNAAKWSGAPSVSVFTEVDRKRVSVFVRDRGSGFDPDDTPADRQGIATSIRGRMHRIGGSVTIRSTVGEGSEVELSVARRNGRT
jgi:signal transduction histidine kinase/phage shock protein PspC (stress-responsive transcriptional regulator)